MVNTDAVAIDIVAAGNVIDDLEASTGVFGTQDKKDLAAYQLKLASGRTTQTQDEMFLVKSRRYFSVKKGKK